MKRILQTTLLGAALFTAAVQAAGDSEANKRLSTAAKRGDLAGVQKELPPTGKADVNASTPGYDLGSSATVLGYAVANGHLEVVNALIKAGADVNAKDSSGYSVLDVASFVRRTDIFNALKAAGAKD